METVSLFLCMPVGLVISRVASSAGIWKNLLTVGSYTTRRYHLGTSTGYLWLTCVRMLAHHDLSGHMRWRWVRKETLTMASGSWRRRAERMEAVVSPLYFT